MSPSMRSCAISNDRARRSEIIARPFASTVEAVCTMKTCAERRSHAVRDGLRCIASRRAPAEMLRPLPAICMKVSFGERSVPISIGTFTTPSRPIRPISMGTSCRTLAAVEAIPDSRK